MKRETTSTQEFLGVMFVLNGCAIISFQNLIIQKDAWLSIFFSLVLAIPFYLFWARLQIRYPQQDLYQIIAQNLGKFTAKLVYALLLIPLTIMSLYFIYSLITFIMITLHDTSKSFLYWLPCLLTIYLTKLGFKILTKIAALFLLIFIPSTLLLLLALIPQMNFEHLQPFLAQGFPPVLKGALALLISPLGTILEIMLFADTFSFKTSPSKVYLISLILGGFMILSIFTFIIPVLGSKIASEKLFPCFDAFARLNIKNLITHIENIPYTNLLLSSFIKICFSIFSILKIFTRLFNVKDHGTFATPIVLIIITLSYNFLNNTTDLLKFQDILIPFLFPFRIIIPLAIWLALESKRLLSKKNF